MRYLLTYLKSQIHQQTPQQRLVTRVRNPADVPVEGPGEAGEQQEPHPPTHVPAEDIEQPQDPGNPNLIPVQPPIPMANNQLNWSHFRPEFSGTPSEDAEAHLLRMGDWMTTVIF